MYICSYFKTSWKKNHHHLHKSLHYAHRLLEANFEHTGKAELGITGDATKIELQASRPDIKEKEATKSKKRKNFRKTATERLQNVVWNDVLFA